MVGVSRRVRLGLIAIVLVLVAALISARLLSQHGADHPVAGRDLAPSSAASAKTDASPAGSQSPTGARATGSATAGSPTARTSQSATPSGSAGRTVVPPVSSAVDAPAPTASTSTTSATAPRPVWHPRPGTTWQWQITGTVDTTVQPATMFDIDLQDAVPSARRVSVPGFGTVTWPQGVNAGVVARLHSMGKIVICYMDSGAWESYRPDAALFPRSVIGNTTGWDGEDWLDIRSQSWSAYAPLIWARMDLARSIGCDGIEPDQNNPWGNDPGFAISLAQQKAWYLEVARQAHLRGLSVGMKNGIETTDATTIAAFDWDLNEECFQYDECSVLSGFIAAGKAVFQTEYALQPTAFCPTARAMQFSSMKKRYALDAWRITC